MDVTTPTSPYNTLSTPLSLNQIVGFPCELHSFESFERRADRHCHACGCIDIYCQRPRRVQRCSEQYTAVVSNALDDLSVIDIQLVYHTPIGIGWAFYSQLWIPLSRTDASAPPMKSAPRTAPFQKTSSATVDVRECVLPIGRSIGSRYLITLKNCDRTLLHQKRAFLCKPHGTL